MQGALADAGSEDFRLLARSVRDARLLEPRVAAYGVRIALTLAAFGAGWGGVLLLGDSWRSLLPAAFLGVMFTQVAFLAHDAGHQQVFRTPRANRALGMLAGDALIGLSFGWWVPKHSRHHAHPNHVGRDPDLGGGLLTLTFAEGARRGRTVASRVLLRWQGAAFFPLLLLQGAGLHVSSVQDLVRRRDRSAALEGSLLAVHAALYLTVVLWVLDPVHALAFVAVQQAVFGLYLGCSFAPNHKGMPVVEGPVEMSFARRQVTTARNVQGGWLVGLLLGGLNLQIEHHLFPTMPRPNLRRSQALVRAFCVDSGLGYCEERLLQSYGRTIRHLRAVGRAGPADQTGDGEPGSPVTALPRSPTNRPFARCDTISTS